MWVEETKQGKYKYTERFKDPLTGKYRRVSVTLDKNTRQAYKMAQTALQERIQEAMEPQKKTITLSQLIDLYHESQKQTAKASTYDRNYNVLTNVARILNPCAIVGNLTSGYVKKALLESGKDNVTLNQYLIRFKAMLRWAYKNDYVENIW